MRTVFRAGFGAGAALLLLSACNSGTEGTFETEDGESGTYSVDADGGSVDMTVSGENGGELSVRSGAQAVANMPDGFSVYPGAEVITSATVNQADGTGVMVLLQSSDSPDKLIGFYRRQAEAAGVTISGDSSINGTLAIGGESEDGIAFTFSASPNGEGTSGQLVVGRGMGN